MPDLSGDISGWNFQEENLSNGGFSNIDTYDAPTFHYSEGGSFKSAIGSSAPIIGPLLGGIGGYIAGQEEASADEYNASLALMEGNFQVEQIGLEESHTLSSQRAAYAKAGVESSGSVLDTALNTATQYEYSKQISTFNSQSAANMDKYEAKVAKQKGDFALASGILQSGVQAAMMFA